MDRNSIIGMVLIGLLIIGMGIVNKPARDARNAELRRRDSIARAEQQKAYEAAQEQAAQEQAAQAQAVQVADSTGAGLQRDSVSLDHLSRRLGEFASAAVGSPEEVVLENDQMKLTFSTRGGRPYRVNLKQYRTHDSLPLILFDGDSTVFALNFMADYRNVNTGELYFTPSISASSDDQGRTFQELTMTLDITDSASIAYIYRLYDEDYMLDFDVKFRGLNAFSTSDMKFLFEFYAPSLEKGFQNESMYTTLYYKYHGGDVQNFRTRSKKEYESVDETTKIEWVAFSHQFFSSILIADDAFLGGSMSQRRFTSPGRYLRYYKASMDLPFEHTARQQIGMKLYLGPNKFTSLKSYGDLDLQSVVTVGGAMIRWLNAYVIIPIFNWLNRWISNYGIIILLLTLIIKVALFPLTYRSYKSQAVMRVLKPQVDEINAKYPKQEDAMKKQQATMDLYKRAGANPMGGCLPMLLQFPILYAMFRFFPTSIELRQQKFLWAHDLSTYDSILDLPFNIPMYGDHVSLFTLLMTVTTILSMRWNNQASASSSSMPGMKTMMYIMPVMFMLILNNFSAGLTYYYFLANLITLGQNLIFKQFIDEEAILKRLDAKKNKPAKKSRFAQRLADLQKQQQGRKPLPKKKSR